MRFAAITALTFLCTRLAVAEQPAGPGPVLAPRDKARIERLCRELGHGDKGKRWKAAEALVNEGEKATGPLWQILRGEWLEGKKMAAYILGKIPAASSAEALSIGLADKDKDVRWKAAVSMVQIGAPALPALRKQVQAKSVLARQCAAWALGELRDAEAIPLLVGAMGDENDEVRWKATISLKQIGDSSLPGLVITVHTGSDTARQAAVWAIGELGTPAAHKALDSLTRDPDPVVRAKTAVAAANIGGETGLRLVQVLLTDRVRFVRKEATLSLTKLFKDVKEVPKPPKAGLYGLFEVGFNAERKPPSEAEKTQVIFLSPSGKEHTVKRFLYRDGRALARISPDEVGFWYYEFQKPGKELPESKGILECLQEPDSGGSIRIARSAPPSLSYQDGSPYFPIGAGTMGLNSRKRDGGPAHSVEDWEEYLGRCGRSGINHVRLFLLEVPWVPPGEVAEYPEFSPWVLEKEKLRYDLGRFEPKFWDKLDRVLYAAHRSRVIVELVLFDELGMDQGKGRRWDLHPFNSKNGGPVESAETGWPAFYDLASEPNRQAQERYLTHLLARVSAFPNVYFELNNEMGGIDLGEDGMKWVLHWVEFFKKNDPTGRPLSLSALEHGRRYLGLTGIDIINLHGGAPARTSMTTKPHMLSMPTTRTESEERALLWRSLLNGMPCAGSPWRPMRGRGEFFKATSGLAAFAAKYDAWQMRANSSAILTLPPGTEGASGGTKGVLWVYLHGQFRGQGNLRLGIAGDQLQLTWLSPESLEVIREGVGTPRGGMLSVRPPEFDRDILLRIEPKAKDALK